MKGHKKYNGFGLIEGLMAITLLGIALAGIIPVFISYQNVNNQSELRSNAILAAEQVMDQLKNRPFEDWETYRTETNGHAVTVGSYDYSITLDFQAVTGLNATRRVDVGVSRNGKTYFEASTIVTNFNNINNDNDNDDD